MIPHSMDKKYISIDIEASGPTPGKYSMISFGACIVGNRELQFYRELKPLNHNYVTEAMKIGCLGLRCLDNLKSQDEFNPKSGIFNPRKVLELLSDVGEEVQKALSEYVSWIKLNTKGFKPIEAATAIKFDAMFTSWYFDNFYDGENPLGHSGEDMNSFYRGIMRNPNVSMKDLNLRDERSLPHNALEDAIQQAKEFEEVLRIMKSE